MADLFSVNTQLLLGNITRDAELRYTASGTPVVSFSVATSHSVKKNNQYENIATFHNVVFWGKWAEKMVGNGDLMKGQKVYVEGRTQHREWESQNGKKKITEVVADRVIVMSGKKKSQSNYDDGYEDDNLPF